MIAAFPARRVPNRSQGWILALLLVHPGRISAIPFEAHFEAYTTGVAPRGVALGDVDSDGDLDCVTANASEPGLSILRGIEGSGFEPAESIALPPAVDLVLAPLDDDATLDVAVAVGGLGVEVWRGDGTGGFTPAEHLLQGFGVGRVWAAHVDADAILDLVVFDLDLQVDQGRVGVLLGVGNAQYSAVQWTDFVPYAMDVAIGDADADGFLDVAIAHGLPEGVSVLFGTGDGSFTEQLDLALPTTPWSVGMGRFDTAAGADLAVHYESVEFGQPVHRIAIWTADGSRGFTRQADAIPFGPTLRLTAIDLDFDGDDELIATASRLGVLKGLGAGTFLPAHPYESGSGPFGTAAGDVDGDGRLDLVVAVSHSNCIAVLRGQVGGDLGNARLVFTGPSPQAIVAADLDADGRADLALTSPVLDAIAVHRGLANAAFASRSEVAVVPEPAGLASGDVDADGRLDLVTASFAPQAANAVTVRRGTGGLNFGPRQDAALTGPATSVALADLDGDGDDDVVAALWTRSDPLDGEVAVLRSRGDGGLDAPQFYDVGPLPWSIAVGDLNADGALDLAIPFRVTATGLEGGVTLLFGVGDGAFTGRTDIPTGIEPRGVAIADLNADGHQDLAVTNSAFASSEPPDVLILLGDGTGAMTQHVRLEVGLEPQAIVAADFDADGKVDLATANSSAFTVSVLPGLGDGSFGPRSDFGAGARSRMLAVADVNGDTRLDLLVANEFGSSASVLLNRSAVTPVVFESIEARRTAAGVEIAWRWNPAVDLARVEVERAPAATGPYVALGVITRDATALFFDPLAPDQTAWYRLRAWPAGATSAPLHVGPAAAPARTAIFSAREAADGSFAIRFTLAAPATRLTIHDVAGRSVASLPVEGLGPGEHLRAWEPRGTTGRGLARGIYWVRLEAGAAVASHRILRLRP